MRRPGEFVKISDMLSSSFRESCCDFAPIRQRLTVVALFLDCPTIVEVPWSWLAAVEQESSSFVFPLPARTLNNPASILAHK